MQVARRWIDTEHVDPVFDIANSAVALAVNDVLRNSYAALLATTNDVKAAGLDAS